MPGISVLIKAKVLVTSALAVLLLCGHMYGVAQEFERKDDKVMRRGLDFEFTENKEASFTTSNSAGKVVHVARAIQLPTKVNGAKVYTHTDSRATYADSGFHKYLLTNMASELATLSDGEYTLNLRDIVIDGSGVIVFFGYEGIRSLPPTPPLAQEKQVDLFNKLCAVMENADLFTPAVSAGQKVASFYDDKDIWEARFKVKDHVFYDLKKGK